MEIDFSEVIGTIAVSLQTCRHDAVSCYVKMVTVHAPYSVILPIQSILSLLLELRVVSLRYMLQATNFA